ncbi:MAG: hypothetical protein IKN38_00120 [Clostridia bacterium]|nr:hypothetical protein [Clostridia bacterium]
MEDEKKLVNENKELSDEQANDAAGGARAFATFTCKKCGGTFAGRGISTSSGTFCADCVPIQTLI